ncbi:MAG: hypothetical protein GY731_17790 [Gammaproteobacteria bacterium]|nr:hypothetical protein [Gammaproteobacteria bacterium]
MASQEKQLTEFDRVAQAVVELGNRLINDAEDADDWEVASGIMAGAVHFWLFSRQPCGDVTCDSCEEVDTAEKRLRILLEEVRESAADSEYYHSPHDTNVGTA